MTPTEWLDQPVRITRNEVSFGEHPLPGVIAEGGITIKPIDDGFTELTIKFLVGQVIVADPYAEQHVRVEPARDPIILKLDQTLAYLNRGDDDG